jgi:nitrate reductase gamma subunit
MENLLSFLSGPGLYASLGVFLFGLGARFALYFLGLDWRLERVAYKADLAQGLKGGAHSAVKWLLPFATHGWRAQPFVTVAFFMLHLGAVLVPLFLAGHNVVLKEALGFSLPSMPQWLADGLTALAVLGLGLIMLRRVALPEVRILSTAYDYFIILLVLAPFVSGFMAVQRLGDYDFWLLTHIISGELLLVLAPFTKLSHIALYFASRIQIGMDYAIKRGGHSRRGGALFPW